MPGRGRGRGLKGLAVPKEPSLSNEQLALLKADHPPPIKGQFEDPPSSDNNKVSSSSQPVANKDSSLDPVPNRDISLATILKNETSSEKTVASLDPVCNDNSLSDTIYKDKPFSTSSKKQVSSIEEIPPPKTNWNLDAPEFVPNLLEQSVVGGASLEETETVYYPDIISSEDILSSFDHKTTGDHHPLLSLAADMLWQASLYPGTFDTYLSQLSNLLKTTSLTNDVLSDIAEMLVSLGIYNDSLRFTAIKMNDYLCKLSSKEMFRPLLFSKLQERYTNLKSTSYVPEDDISELVETTFYIAEMFHRVRVKDQVVWVLGSATLDLVNKLLNHHTNESVIKACNVIKLIGYLLQNKTPKTSNFNPVMKLEEVKVILRDLTVDKNLSSHASNVVLSVMTLSGSNWGMGPGSSPKPTKVKVIPELPVLKPEDWEEYVDDSGYVIEGEDYREPTICLGDQSDPNIDEELMREYEDFVQDFEDHLMMQEFGQS